MNAQQKLVTCEEVITFLLAYLSQELPQDKERDFEDHLAVCPSCVAYLKTYQATVALGKAAAGTANDDAAPTELGRELARAILEARPRAAS